MKRLGIIGGLGPETSCKFCLNINNKFRQLTNCQPDIVLENLPVSAEAERKIIHGQMNEEHFNLLVKAVDGLNNNQVDFIVIPCNTIHVFIDDLRDKSGVPILSIIEETADLCKMQGFKQVGLLASTKTVKEKLHEKELRERGIKTINLNENKLEEVSEIIIRIIHNKERREDKEFLLKCINELKDKGAEAVILGCTDLKTIMKEAELPLIDTLEVLENSTLNLLTPT